MGKFWYGVGTGNAQLQLEGQKQLYSTINPKNALNPVKKIKNVKKLGETGKKLKISRQKQNKHIEGTKEHTQAIQNGDTKSVWKNPADADKLTKEAHEKGTPYKGQENKLIYDVGKQVGKDPKETKIQVHKSKTGVHGNPHK